MIGVVMFVALLAIYGMAGNEDRKDAANQAQLTRQIVARAQVWAVRK